MGKTAILSNNLKRLREASGMTQEQAAERFGLSKSGYVKIEDGERGLKSDRATRAAEIFGVTIAEVIGGHAAPGGEWLADPAIVKAMEETAAREPAFLQVVGEVAAGRWLEADDCVDEPEHDPVPVHPDPRWRADAQYGLVVRGTSLNRIALDGDILACVDAYVANYEPREDDLVIVEMRRNAGLLRQRTAKRYMRQSTHVELWPDSDDPKWQKPIIIPHGPTPLEAMIEDEDGDGRIAVTIAALVTWVHRPIQRRRR